MRRQSTQLFGDSVEKVAVALSSCHAIASFEAGWSSSRTRIIASTRLTMRAGAGREQLIETRQ